MYAYSVYAFCCVSLQAYEKYARDFKQTATTGDSSSLNLPRSSGRPPRSRSRSPRQQEEEELSIVEQELQAANDKFKGVLQDCTSLMAKLTDTASKNKQYNQLKSQLGKTLPDIEDKVNQCSVDLGPGKDAESQLSELNGVTADVVTQGKLVEDLSRVGHELIGILEELDCKDTPKAREIQATVDEIQNRYDQVQESVVDKQHTLNAAMVKSKDADHNLTSLLTWVKDTEAVLDNSQPVSLDREVLNEQIQAHRVLASEIENHRAQVDSTIEQCQNKPGAQESVNELLDRFDALLNHSQERGNDLDDVVQKLGSLHGNVNQLESWLTNAVNSLKRESSGFDAVSLRNKIENLYKQKQGKQEVLDSIKKIGKELIDDPNTGDKNKLRETLADTQGKWHDLTELLVQMISFAVSTHVVVKYFIHVGLQNGS